MHCVSTYSESEMEEIGSKGNEGDLVGYKSESGVYQVYHPQKRKVVVSWDLIIYKDEFV